MYTSHTLSSASILSATVRQDISLIFIAENPVRSLFSLFCRYSYIFAGILAFFSFEPHGAYAATFEREFVVTAYYSPVEWQSWYSKWSFEAEKKLNGNGIAWANGKPVFMGMIAAPKSYSYGTRIHFEWLGVGIVEDRGWAIVKAWERGQSYDRIDIWMGTWESGLIRARNWWIRKVKGTITTDTDIPVLDFRDIDDKRGDYSKVSNTISGSTGLGSTVLSMFDDLGYPKEDGQTEKEMIREFQLDHGIIKTKEDEGAWVYGPRTRAMLESEHAKYIILRDAELARIEREKNALLSEYDTFGTTYTAATEIVSTIGTPKKWETGNHIATLQNTLKRTGYLKARTKVNGVMNTSTIMAIKTLQRKNKLPTTGTLDTKTKELLILTLVEKA
jgi:3D (Asp-Asp-Asp) domain-containing protein